MILKSPPTGTSSRRASARTRTRELLLDAAASEFAGEGYRGARVERIAERAGVTTGALYDHFGSKARLFTAAWSWASERITDDLDATARSTPPRDLASVASEQWLARHREDPRWFQLRLELVVHPADRAEARQELLAGRDAELARLRRLVEVAVADRLGRVRGEAGTGPVAVPAVDLDELALVVRALANGLLIEELAAQPGTADRDAAPSPALPAGLLGRWVDHLITIATKETP